MNHQSTIVANMLDLHRGNSRKNTSGQDEPIVLHKPCWERDIKFFMLVCRVIYNSKPHTTFPLPLLSYTSVPQYWLLPGTQWQDYVNKLIAHPHMSVITPQRITRACFLAFLLSIYNFTSTSILRGIHRAQINCSILHRLLDCWQ